MENLIQRIISGRLCWTEYQPIVDTTNEKIIGYEALARFYHEDKQYAPDMIFNACKNDNHTLKLLELLAKEYQFEYRPKDNLPIFVNISPNMVSEEACKNFWIDLLKNRKNFVVEITESYNNKNMEATLSFMTALAENQIAFAVDDLYSPEAHFSPKLLFDAPIIKIDRIFYDRIKVSGKNSTHEELLKATIKYCNRNNKMLILEGVENAMDFVHAKGLGARYMQGFHFKNNFFHNGPLYSEA